MAEIMGSLQGHLPVTCPRIAARCRFQSAQRYQRALIITCTYMYMMACVCRGLTWSHSDRSSQVPENANSAINGGASHDRRRLQQASASNHY
jgi:hypothetical protein